MDKIENYMSEDLIVIDVGSSVQEAAQCMEANHVGSVLVKKNEEYVGLITETDLTRKVIGGKMDPETVLVSEVMTSPILSLDRGLPVDQANEFMLKNKIRHLAVTDEDKIVGILSVKNLVLYYAKTFQMPVPHFFEVNFWKVPNVIKNILIKKGWEVENVVPCQEPKKGAPCQFRIDDKNGSPIGRVGFSSEDLDDLAWAHIEMFLRQDLKIFKPPKEQFMVKIGEQLTFEERSW